MTLTFWPSIRRTTEASVTSSSLTEVGHFKANDNTYRWRTLVHKCQIYFHMYAECTWSLTWSDVTYKTVLWNYNNGTNDVTDTRHKYMRPPAVRRLTTSINTLVSWYKFVNLFTWFAHNSMSHRLVHFGNSLARYPTSARWWVPREPYLAEKGYLSTWLGKCTWPRNKLLG